jgi:hypothetical protein
MRRARIPLQRARHRQRERAAAEDGRHSSEEPLPHGAEDTTDAVTATGRTDNHSTADSLGREELSSRRPPSVADSAVARWTARS